MNMERVQYCQGHGKLSVKVSCHFKILLESRIGITRIKGNFKSRHPEARNQESNL